MCLRFGGLGKHWSVGVSFPEAAVFTFVFIILITNSIAFVVDRLLLKSIRQMGIVLREMSLDRNGNNSFEMLPHVSEEGDCSIRRGRDAIPPAFGNKIKLCYFPICKQSPGAHVSVEDSQELLAECSEHCCQYPFCNAVWSSSGVSSFHLLSRRSQILFRLRPNFWLVIRS